jgi:hypothetical protein
MANDESLTAQFGAAATAVTNCALSLDLYRHKYWDQIADDKMNQISDQITSLNQFASAIQGLTFVEGLDASGTLFAKVVAVTHDLDTKLDQLDGAVAGITKALAVGLAAVNVAGTFASGGSVQVIFAAVDGARTTLAGL